MRHRNGERVDFENLDIGAVLNEIDTSGLSVSQAGSRLSQDDVADYRDLVGTGSGTDETLNIVILGGDAAEGTGLRNLAQTVKDDSGAETVIVRAPHNTQVVSDSLSRYQIESSQTELHGSTAPGDISTFLDSSAAAEPDFGILNVLILVGVLLTVVVAAGFAVVTHRRR